MPVLKTKKTNGSNSYANVDQVQLSAFKNKQYISQNIEDSIFESDGGVKT